MTKYSPIVHALQELINRNISTTDLSQEGTIHFVNKVKTLSNAVREVHNSETRNTKELRDLSLFSYRHILDAEHSLKLAYEALGKDQTYYHDMAVGHHDLAIVYLRLAASAHQIIVSKFEGH